MRCQYRFKVSGRLKIDVKCPIPTAGGIVYELEHNEHGILQHITATVQVTDESEWPSIATSRTPGVALDISVPNPGFGFIRQELRIVEGLLSLYGLESIDVNEPAQSWLPDTDAERERLKLFSFESSTKKLSDEELSATPFNLVGQSFLAAREAWDIDVPLSFFRKGHIDCRERRYIEAIYDFYFLLETVYGEGKSKNQQVKEALKRNRDLLEVIKAAISDKLLLASIRNDRHRIAHYETTYRNKSPEEVIDHIVELRGFLHHHSIRRPGVWHPEDHQRFEVDAWVLENIALAVVFKLAEPFVFAKKTAQRFEEMVMAAQGKGTIHVLKEK